tara:strand:- start:638 stop:1096 length:459 start_codon:yes stop_codon:yes gene_type:complete
VLAKEQQLQLLIEPSIEAMGFELWGLEYLSQGRHTLLRIFIESNSGVTVDSCAEISRHLSSIFDVEDPVAGEYTLEVSSPGIDRPLFKLEQYSGYIGEGIEVKLRTAFDGRRKFNGTLKSLEAEDVVVQVDDHEYLLPFNAIDKAQIKLREV